MPKKLTAKEFISKSKKIHGNKYDYSEVDYFMNKIPVKINCSRHGEFIQRPDSHLRGVGCRKCFNEKNGNIKRKSLEQFIRDASKIHNGFYTYSNVEYKNAFYKIKIKCPIHGEFLQRPNDHLSGKGCLHCSLEKTISRLETEFLNYLHIPKRNRSIHIYPYRVDAYIPETNTIYEFLGDYWHGNPEKHSMIKINKHCGQLFGVLYNNTFNRLEHLKNKGYNVKFIWETSWKNFKRGIVSLPSIEQV